jgi:hypothetical protein
LRPQNNCNVCNTGDIRINGLTVHTRWLLRRHAHSKCL